MLDNTYNTDETKRIYMTAAVQFAASCLINEHCRMVDEVVAAYDPGWSDARVVEEVQAKFGADAINLNHIHTLRRELVGPLKSNLPHGPAKARNSYKLDVIEGRIDDLEKAVAKLAAKVDARIAMTEGMFTKEHDEIRRLTSRLDHLARWASQRAKAPFAYPSGSTPAS